MENYKKAIEIMKQRFSKDSLIALATTDGKTIYNRIIDVLYHEGAFYAITYAKSAKVTQIEINPNVAVAAVDWFTGHAIGKNLGWVLDPKNHKIRKILREEFSWYDEANNEKDENCCFIELKLTEGVLVKDHNTIRYKIDFLNKSVKVSENFGEYK